MDEAEAKRWLEQSYVNDEQLVHANIDFLAELLNEYAQQVSKDTAIKFGIWIKENQGREDFDFRRGDSDEYFDEWQQKQK